MFLVVLTLVQFLPSQNGSCSKWTEITQNRIWRCHWVQKYQLRLKLLQIIQPA